MENELSILIVEDEALIAETIRLMLEDFGYHVAGICYGYDQALGAVCSAEYDLLLTDIDLGEGRQERSGFGLVKALTACRRVPFIFLTAFDDRDIIRQAASLMPSAYLTKPINPASLYACIQVGMEAFRSQQPPAPVAPARPGFFYTKVGRRLVKLDWSAVYQLESVKNYVLVRTAEYPYGLPLRSSLVSVWQAMMPVAQQARFVQISRSMVIDRAIIRSYGAMTVETRYGVFKCTMRPGEGYTGE